MVLVMSCILSLVLELLDNVLQAGQEVCLFFLCSSSLLSKEPKASGVGWGEGASAGGKPGASSSLELSVCRLQWCSGKSALCFPPTKRRKGQELPHKCSQEECLCG